jgi:hypothetical protein
MITLSVARQRLDKHVSAATDLKVTIKDIVRNGVAYKVRAESI